MSLRKWFAQQNLELSLFFVYCFLGRKELLFVKTYLFPNCNAVRSEYQNVVQNSQKGTWSKTPAYSYACTVHELKGKPSSFLFYFAGQPQDPRVPVVLHRMWWIGKCWELWITQGGIFRTIPVGGGGGVLSCICLIGMCRSKGLGFYAVLVWKREKTLPVLVWIRVCFSRECMNVYVVSIPNE